jgi:hypothetical protein
MAKTPTGSTEPSPVSAQTKAIIPTKSTSPRPTAAGHPSSSRSPSLGAPVGAEEGEYLDAGPDDEDGLEAGEIVGIVLGVVLALLAGVLLLLFCRRREKKKPIEDEGIPETLDADERDSGANPGEGDQDL